MINKTYIIKDNIKDIKNIYESNIFPEEDTLTKLEIYSSFSMNFNQDILEISNDNINNFFPGDIIYYLNLKNPYTIDLKSFESSLQEDIANYIKNFNIDSLNKYKTIYKNIDQILSDIQNYTNDNDIENPILNNLETIQKIVENYTFLFKNFSEKEDLNINLNKDNQYSIAINTKICNLILIPMNGVLILKNTENIHIYDYDSIFNMVINLFYKKKVERTITNDDKMITIITK